MELIHRSKLEVRRARSVGTSEEEKRKKVFGNNRAHATVIYRMQFHSVTILRDDYPPRTALISYKYPRARARAHATETGTLQPAPRVGEIM